MTNKEPADSGRVMRLVVRYECRLCGRRFEMTGRWQGCPQGPQCPCNPNTWGNWKRVWQFESDDPAYTDGMIRPIDPKPRNYPHNA
jgi:hypothetical protein